jgi:hypothetical protein
VTSSVKSVIKALSRSRFGTSPAEASIGAERTDRGFPLPSLSDEMLFVGDAMDVIREDDLLSRFDPEILRQIQGRENDPDTLRHDEGKNGDLKEKDNVTPPPVNGKVRSECGGTLPGDLNPDEKPVPEIRSREKFVPEIRSFFGNSVPPTFPSQTDEEGQRIDSYGLGFRSNLRVLDSREGSSSHVAFTAFHPGQTGAQDLGGASDMGYSTRFGRDDRQNVTLRDNKRPKERSRDKAYKTRFSMDSIHGANRSPAIPLGGHAWPREEDGYSSRSPAPVIHGFAQTPVSFPPRSMGGSKNICTSTSPEVRFEITLIYAGTSIRHQVWASMPIAQLMTDAGMIFGLDPNTLILLLFSSVPTTLRRDATISGPPPVPPGSKVMAFYVPDSTCIQNQFAHGQGPDYTSGQHRMGHGQGHFHVPVEFPAPQGFSSKLLSTFKLPKFDGVAKSWKVWEKSFQRFLGFHQLDYVLEEDFPSQLWVAPGAEAANKMVFFLIGDAVATGTLASKLVRQATKWDGHGAFLLLRNGYVFNGPQTATILLAELSKIRLRRDEDASTFCLRLVELIKDLELDAAVYLTDTQKLGYLLSTIRHESGLQSVYSQLLSEQLRGTTSFDQACRELHYRVESMKADDLLDSRSSRALISTEGKKKGQQGILLEKVLCLAKHCKELIQPYLPLCKLCYLQSMAGKISILVLRDNLGNAVFNAETKRLDFPSTVPKNRFPKKNMKKGKALMSFVETTIQSRQDTPPFCSFHSFELHSLHAPTSVDHLPVTAGQDGGSIEDRSASHDPLPVTAGQEGRLIGDTSAETDNSVLLPELTVLGYADSSYGDSKHGAWAFPLPAVCPFPANPDAFIKNSRSGQKMANGIRIQVRLKTCSSVCRRPIN